MSSLNVLVIAYYFPPMGLSGVQRITKFVKYLPEFGWNPVVLTSNTSAYYAFDDSMLDELNERNIKIYRTDEDVTKHIKKVNSNNLSYPSKFRQKVQSMILQTFLQPDSRRFWLKNAMKKADEIMAENRIDVILATAPPFTDFLIAKKIAKKYDIPFVVDYRDLWVDNPYYYYATVFHKNYAIKLERKVLNTAARVIVITRDMKNKLLNRYRILNNNEVCIIPHGFDSEDFEKVQEINKKPNKFVITHSGIFSADLTPTYFFKALALIFEEKPELKKDFEIRFVGILQKKFQKQIIKLGLEDIIHTTKYVQHADAVKNLLESDVLWMMVPNSIVTPSRMYEYMGAKKPMIISSPESELTRIAESTKAAIITDYKSVPELKNAILDYYKKWKTNTLPIPDNSIIEKFDRRGLTQLLSKELALCVKFRPA
jgi:glycosyltransferase involved in cell wall biosynthesis